ncbi:beta-galactoside-binding lectin-like [Brienomyrus brachyistius]|uniref:beta-galactoside-binding lectin-like n=1 Tax=Brienomyrus brachyistius TaxID=42636 RepID=UPI0020B25835|nr:beta-galactoside-binding lectin-like [Brienomyrus brachyistius]
MALTVHNMSVKAGKDLKISGVPQNKAEGFTINLGYGEENIALHFNVRFNQHGDHRTIVFNSKHAGSWSSEQRESNFPFKEGEEFKVYISFSNSTFQIKMPGNTVSFPNRFGANKFMFIQVQGDVRINGFKIS